MIHKQRYEIGQLYTKFTNLRLVGDYKHEVKIFVYDEGHYLKYSLRFMKQGNNMPPEYLCTEIHDNFHNKAMKTLDTLIITKDKSLIDKLGDKIVEGIYTASKW